ncbi:MAG TPA: alpha/beta hydrolase-fold protein [Chryseolinea sp.]|nr:alpha/beta hydrolase-fold protein [Chryseolinea sp.]
MKPVRILILLLIGIFVFTKSSPAQVGNKEKVAIIDAQHYSNVFAEIRHYRIFLPPSYTDNPVKRYPVIYFYHGWSQRYFGSSDNYADFDKGDENKGDNIANFVASHDVIVVKPDGYNRSPDEKYYVRPYNVGPVETYRQFPLYFPELVEHIDTHYNTLADREHRGISGLSMGGFMTFWIAGKYPHLLSAAGNFCGSAEFVVGPKDFPSEYRHIDMYKNYGGVKLRLNYGDKDFIRGYHEDLNRIWPQLLSNYEWKVYDAAHSTCGMSEMFGFILKAFESPLARPSQWDHIDVYPDFSVWGYDLRTDRNVPGFTILENVDRRGFKCSVREFLPAGELLPFVKVAVTTAPVYEKNTEYVIHDIDTRSLKKTQQNVRSDHQGRLIIQLNGSSHEIGINKKGDKPNIRIVSVEVQNRGWITEGKDATLSIKLVNKGLSAGKNVSAKLSDVNGNVIFKQDGSTFGDIAAGEVRSPQTSFTYQVKAGIEIVKFKLAIQDGNKNEWVDFFEMPVKKNVPEIKEFEIADGKTFTVAKGGNDSETIELGSGNGDGIANPGESIVILVKDAQKYWRTDLHTADQFVNPFGVAVRKSDYWGNYDHVGASAKYDIPLIASHCPENHTTEFFAEYWLPDNLLHIIRQGVVKIEVKGRDTTAPQVQWVQVTGENVVRAKILDGSKIQSVKTKLILKNDPAKTFEIELQDDGNAGDGAEGDNVYSKKIPTDKFGIYRVVIEAIDSHGNKMIYERSDDFVLH